MSLIVSAGQAGADDWPVPQHDVRNTGYSSDTVQPPFKLAWRVPTNDKDGFLLAAGDAVCVSSNAVKLYDASSGKLIWTIPDAKALYFSSDILIVVTRQPGSNQAKTVDCYSRRDRTRKWSYPIPAGLFYSFAVETTGNGEISCAAYTNDGHSQYYVPAMTVLSVRDGSVIRTVTNADAQATDGALVYWGSAHWFHVLDATTLKPLWGFYDGGADPVVAGPTVIGHGWGNWATCIDVSTRKAVWRHPVWRDSIHTLLHTPDGHVLILEHTNVPVAVTAFATDADHIAWQHFLCCVDYGNVAQAAGAGHYAFVAGWHQHLPGQQAPRGGFYCLDADTGAERWKYEQPRVQGSAIIISGGCLYGIDAEGYLYRFAPQH